VKDLQHTQIAIEIRDAHDNALVTDGLAANNLGFGLALAEICQTFGNQQSHGGMACPKSATQSLLNIVTLDGSTPEMSIFI
jgi:hypothetical protein